MLCGEPNAPFGPESTYFMFWLFLGLYIKPNYETQQVINKPDALEREQLPSLIIISTQ